MSEYVKILKRRLQKRLTSTEVIDTYLGIPPKEPWLDSVWFSAYLYIKGAMDKSMLVDEIIRFGRLNNFEILEFIGFVETQKGIYDNQTNARGKARRRKRNNLSNLGNSEIGRNKMSRRKRKSRNS